MQAAKAAVAVLTFLVSHSAGLAAHPTNDNVESPAAEQVEAWIADPSMLSTRLRAVSTLNVEAANVLVKHKVAEGDRRLPLDGLTSITPEVARILSFREGGEPVGLSLNGLKTITPEVAEALASGERGGLSLGGLTTISVEVAKELSGIRRKLMLNGLKDLSREAAVELAKHHSKLTLFGLTDLSDEAAEALSHHRGTFLLNGLTKLTSAPLAKELLRLNDGFMKLSKVEIISDEVAVVLAEYQGKRPIPLPGLTTLSEANAALLRANQRIELPPQFQKTQEE
ncbi:hypothetical protein [Lignipirellula cremea]|uniref:Leucine Rich repeats (2 copies) n=1 Tax=Lignipirellula cremea TaxID=2528010 RepID=A0A518DKC5_9BACT|nr:hypothetical protein [Lignipirellula cremea]QDU92289.1 hypothetical protein Pla8534_00340 [Lignipirellula cremea]